MFRCNFIKSKDHFLKEQLTGMNINQKYKNKDETNISIA